VAGIAAGRWAVGQGAEYARLTLAPGRDADADALTVAVAAISDAGAYVAIVEAIVPVLVDLKSERGARGLMADIAVRVPLFKDATLQQLAPVVRGIQSLTSPDPVISALQTAIGAAGVSAISETTSLARAFVDAKVAGATALPPVLAVHAAAQGTIDLAQAGWLVGQKGVKRDDVRTALISMIGSESAAVLAPALQSVQGRLSRAWQIGKALVERAAVSPDLSRDEWLVLAEDWNVPPRRGNGRTGTTTVPRSMQPQPTHPPKRPPPDLGQNYEIGPSQLGTTGGRPPSPALIRTRLKRC
jgi:hypothetical protein